LRRTKLERAIAQVRWRYGRFADDFALQAHRARFLGSLLSTLATTPALRNDQGVRFLELASLLTDWLKDVLERSPELGHAICAQFDNVIGHCDEITYDEDGAAQAYVILHFLDRYHRFQMTFDALARQGLMPSRSEGMVLDIGTGPGPSMFAVSDFYRSEPWRFRRRGPLEVQRGISIDYAESSTGFRNWLHHFTEVANYWAPSRVGWNVPYHHGSTHDFAEIDFNRRYASHEYDDDGGRLIRTHVEKVRPDLIIMSNFLTTEEQARRFAGQLQDCARHLRHDGLLLIVGARRTSPKYAPVYDAIDDAVLGGSYSRSAYRAWCERIDLEESVLSYDYADPWGQEVKKFYATARHLLRAALGEDMPRTVDDNLAKWSSSTYSRPIAWEVTVYRKHAIPRRAKIARRRGPARSATG
jgi:hypothetical protein